MIRSYREWLPLALVVIVVAAIAVQRAGWVDWKVWLVNAIKPFVAQLV